MPANETPNVLREEGNVFERDGIVVVQSVVAADTVNQLRGLPQFGLGTPGQRGKIAPAAVSALIASDGPLTVLATKLMQQTARAVRVLYFDKSDAANWSVPWHQDRAVAVARREDVPGYDVWSIKDGIPHVEPSVEVLSSMVAIRLHLDDCPQDNGPLLAVRRSCGWGRVTARDLRGLIDKGEAAAYACHAGDVVAMRGLTVHASERAVQPGHRRVLHVDYATRDLPAPLTWAI